MPNVVAAWLEILGTPERAAKLQAGNWRDCPTKALFGQSGSERVYVNPRYTAACDSWDTGLTVRRDIMQWAAFVAKGGYGGPVYRP